MQNKLLIGIVIIGVIFGGTYYMGQQQVKQAVGQLEIEYSDFSVDRISLLPPEIDLTLTYSVINPSDLPLEISMDGAIYYGETKISPVIVAEKAIPAMGAGTVDAQISLNGTLLQAIGDPQNEGSYSLRGTLIATGQYLGVLPVSVTMDLSDLESQG
jgi:hypothetical protein